jgi:hypothetical protein
MLAKKSHFLQAVVNKKCKSQNSLLAKLKEISAYLQPYQALACPSSLFAVVLKNMGRQESILCTIISGEDPR